MLFAKKNKEWMDVRIIKSTFCLFLLQISISCLVFSVQGNEIANSDTNVSHKVRADGGVVSIGIRLLPEKHESINLLLYNSNPDRPLLTISIKDLMRRVYWNSYSSYEEAYLDRELTFSPSVISGNREDDVTRLIFEEEPELDNQSRKDQSDDGSAFFDIDISVHWDMNGLYVYFRLNGQDAEQLDFSTLLQARGILVRHVPYLTRVDVAGNLSNAVRISQEAYSYDIAKPVDIPEAFALLDHIVPVWWSEALANELGFYEPPSAEDIFSLVQFRIKQAANDHLTPVFIYTLSVDEALVPEPLKSYMDQKVWVTTTPEIDSAYDLNSAVELGFAFRTKDQLLIDESGHMKAYHNSYFKVGRLITFGVKGDGYYHSVSLTQNPNKYTAFNHEAPSLCTHQYKDASVSECVGFAQEHTSLHTRVIVIAMNEEGEMKIYWSAHPGYAMDVEAQIGHVHHRYGYQTSTSGSAADWYFQVKGGYKEQGN